MPAGLVPTALWRCLPCFLWHKIFPPLDWVARGVSGDSVVPPVVWSDMVGVVPTPVPCAAITCDMATGTVLAIASATIFSISDYLPRGSPTPAIWIGLSGWVTLSYKG